MTDGNRTITIPRHNPIHAITSVYGRMSNSSRLIPLARSRVEPRTVASREGYVRTHGPSPAVLPAGVGLSKSLPVAGSTPVVRKISKQ